MSRFVLRVSKRNCVYFLKGAEMQGRLVCTIPVVDPSDTKIGVGVLSNATSSRAICSEVIDCRDQCSTDGD